MDTKNKLNTKSKESTKKAWKRKQGRHMEHIEQKDRGVQIYTKGKHRTHRTMKQPERIERMETKAKKAHERRGTKRPQSPS